MEYKSNRSDKFHLWLKEMTPEKVEKLIALEKAARLLVHRYNFLGEVESVEVSPLARIVHKIQEDYEKEQV